MNLPRLTVLFILACGLVLTGCLSTSKLGEISVSLVDIKPVGGTVFESRAVLTLRFVNENVIPFSISGSSHKVYLNGSYVGKAVSNEPLGLQPQSTATRDVTVFLENTVLLKEALSLGRSSTISYRLDNIVFTTDGEDKVQLRSETKGSLDLQNITERIQ
jgi:LEA14-like dessication related protein